MQEIISNWTKIVAGICIIVISIGYATGHVTQDGLNSMIGLLVGGQAIHNGAMGLLK